MARRPRSSRGGAWLCVLGTLAACAVAIGPAQPPAGITATHAASAAAISWNAPASLGTGTLTGKPADVPVLSFPAPPAGQVGVPYRDTLAVSGGTGPFAWSVSAGRLKAGITLNASTGVLSGTPTAVGSSAFTVQVSDADGEMATEAVTLAIGADPLVIAASAGTSPAAPGGTVDFTITVSNTSTTPFTGATFTDALARVLDGATYNADATAAAGAVSFDSPNLTWTGNLAAGAAATITFSVTVRNPAAGREVLSAVITSATPGTNCPAAGIDPRCAVAVPISGLTIVKTASSATAAPGQQVTYTITVTNSGRTPYTGARFTDALGGVLDDATYDADASATAGTVTFASPTLSWTGDLAVGAAATITFAVTVRNPDTGDHILASILTSATAGSNCPAAGTDPRCTTVVKVAGLGIVDHGNVSTTRPGGVVRYTATFTNTGQVPYTGITIATDAANVFDDAVPNGDQTATSGTLTVTSTGVSWTGGIPVGGIVTVTGTVTVDDPDPGNHVLTANLGTAAPGSNCPAGSADPACTSTIPVLAPALSIVKTADTTAAVPGQVIGFTITVTNTGQTPYTGAAVTDSLAQLAGNATYDGDAAATTGTVSFTRPYLVWTGILAPGATAVITYSVTVSNPGTGDKRVTSSSTAPGPTCPPGTTSPNCRASIPLLTSALTITTTASTASALAGSTVGYKITVANTGQTPYTGATFSDPLTGVLGDAAYDNDAAIGTGTGTVTYTSSTLSWTGDLAAGATATITYSITIDNPVTSDLTLTNTVTSDTSGSNCPSGSADTRCAATVTVIPITIGLSNLSSTFTLTGVPGDTTQQTAVATMTVDTNDPTGYAVTVQPSAPTLAGSGITAAIPVSDLQVRGTGQDTYRPLSATTPTTIHTQSSASAPTGDFLSADYQITIPDITSGTYTTTLNYIATAAP